LNISPKIWDWRKVSLITGRYSITLLAHSESKALLDYLYSEAMRPEFQCRFQWAAGSIAFWDNLMTWHYALNDYHGYPRLMHRITVAGQALLN